MVGPVENQYSIAEGQERDGHEPVPVLNSAGSNPKPSISRWKIICLGQVAAFTIAASGATQATLHLGCGISAPTFTAGFFYLILSFQFLPYLLCHREYPEGRKPLPLWFFSIAAFLDVEANYLTILAFRYTTLTSVALLDSLAIPSAMILSRCWLRHRHTCLHFVGAALCIAGSIQNGLADYESDQTTSSKTEHLLQSNRLRGDIYAALGGILYGVNDVLTEWTVGRLRGLGEYLGKMGFFATILSILQTLVLERRDLTQFFQKPECGTGSAFGLLTLYVLLNVLGYNFGSSFLLASEATLFNLSILTADLWSLLFSLVAEPFVPSALFWVASAFIIGGVIVYELAPSPLDHDEAPREEINDLPLGYDQGIVSHAATDTEMT